MPTDKAVTIEKDGPVTTVILCRPERRNAVDRSTATALAEAFLAFEQDDDARVGVLFGDAGTFCAGADLKAVAGASGDRPPRARAPRTGDDFDPLADDGPMGPSRFLLSKPVIAAVSGYAVAGGIELALWCDMRIVEEPGPSSPAEDAIAMAAEPSAHLRVVPPAPGVTHEPGSSWGGLGSPPAPVAPTSSQASPRRASCLRVGVSPGFVETARSGSTSGRPSGAPFVLVGGACEDRSATPDLVLTFEQQIAEGDLTLAPRLSSPSARLRSGQRVAR